MANLVIYADSLSDTLYSLTEDSSTGFINAVISTLGGIGDWEILWDEDNEAQYLCKMGVTGVTYSATCIGPNGNYNPPCEIFLGQRPPRKA